jgi:hypothetical protein
VISLVERSAGSCNYFRKVWLDGDGRAFVFSCYYWKLSVLGTDGVDCVLFLGEDLPLFLKLEECVREFPSFDDVGAIVGPFFGQVPEVIRSFYRVVDVVRGRAQLARLESCELIDFCVVSSEIGMFMALIDVLGVVDSVVLFVGKNNSVSPFWDCVVGREFLSLLFDGIFQFDWSEDFDRAGRVVCLE